MNNEPSFRQAGRSRTAILALVLTILTAASLVYFLVLGILGSWDYPRLILSVIFTFCFWLIYKRTRARV
ncbi:MAG: hypothetical protein IPM63_09620 [Acidobacteriota bacterium]|nr:MAG: hypothetical protein IPM63_09620 [Acidobacteriota bacterium]